MNEKGTNVLEQYDFQLLRCIRGRGALICETDRGWMLLKEYTGSLHRLYMEERVLDILGQEGISVDSYVKNRNGQVLSVDLDGTKYVLKHWFSGRECDVKNPAEIQMAVKTLGRVHCALRKAAIMLAQENREEISRLTAPSLLTTFEKHQREMKKIRTFIRGKQKKTEFELQILHNFDNFYQDGEVSLKDLHSSAYQKLKERADSEGWLCHGNYNQHNILVEEKGMAVVNFEKLSVDVQLVDLYLFMRKILEKYNWDVEMGRRMLESYQGVLGLSEEERAVLRHLFFYPEKFWKLLNHYYNNNKAWVPQKDVEKLDAVVRQDMIKKKSLDKIFNSD